MGKNKKRIADKKQKREQLYASVYPSFTTPIIVKVIIQPVPIYDLSDRYFSSLSKPPREPGGYCESGGGGC